MEQVKKALGELEGIDVDVQSTESNAGVKMLKANASRISIEASKGDVASLCMSI